MSFKWATVTGVNPLRITLDGDTEPLPFAPDSLIDPLTLVVADRLRVELSGNRLVVLGRMRGAAVSDDQLPGRLRNRGPEISNMNLNDALFNGWYRGYSVTNAPTTAWFYFEVMAHVFDSWVHQRATPLTSSGTIFQRWRLNGVWSSWQKLAVVGQDGTPFAQSAGSASADSTAPDTTVTFPAGRFSVAPIMGGQIISRFSAAEGVDVLFNNVTSTSFGLRVSNNPYGFNINWTAIQMTSGSAAG